MLGVCMQVAYHLSKFLGGKPLADLTEKERMRLAEGAVLGGPYERPPGRWREPLDVDQPSSHPHG